MQPTQADTGYWSLPFLACTIVAMLVMVLTRLPSATEKISGRRSLWVDTCLIRTKAESASVHDDM